MIAAVKNVFLGFVVSLAKSILESTANNLWGETWEIIFEGIDEAEDKWDDGKAKKEYVLDKVMELIDKQGRLGRIKKMIVKIFVNIVIDALINNINEEIGHDWSEKAGKYERKLADKIDFID